MELNLIIPAGGKSSRYNEGKPKWLRTHPDGNLMIEHAVSALTSKSEKLNIYIITNKQVENKYDLKAFLKDTRLKNLEIILLENETSSSVETIYRGIKENHNKFNFKIPTIIKDSDNFVKLPSDIEWDKYNFTVGVNLNDFDVNRIKNKSFLVTNDLDDVIDFVEKRVVSDKISVGTHCFKDFNIFFERAERFLKSKIDLELYNSHVIASLIYDGQRFKYVQAENFIDFGTQKEWNEIFKNHTTYLVDFDGTLVINKGKNGRNNWANLKDKVIHSNIEVFKKLKNKGAKIIITTSRSEIYRKYIFDFLKSNSLEVDDVICGLNHSPRVIINDFANTNPYPSCNAISIPRNGDLKDYFEYDF
jgi:histidinol phosphatase-like enzyme